MSNTALWQRVFMTDPRAVKPITGKPYQGNSPKPFWLIERATQEFGPIGIGWGVIVKSERFERLGEFDVLHVAVVSVWYVLDGKRSETFDQMGGTKAAYMTGAKDGKPGKLIVDEDAGKKSVTDGMVKCLSMIGFAGDIFSGRWDDSKYVAEALKAYKTAEDDAAREEAGRLTKHREDELTELAFDMVQEHRGGRDMNAIKTWYNPATFSKQNDIEQQERIFVWGLLREESKLRSAIKANKPAPVTA